MDHVTTIPAPDNQLERASTDNGSDLDENRDDVSPPLFISISQKTLDGDVTMTSHRETEEFQTHVESADPNADEMQSTGAETDPLRSSEGQNYQTSEVNGVKLINLDQANEMDGEVQHKSTSTGTKPGRSMRTAGPDDRTKPRRVCDDCKAGLVRNSTGNDRKQRWNSPASQQSSTRSQKSSKSTARSSQTSVSDQTSKRTASSISTEDRRRNRLANSLNAPNRNSQRTAKHCLLYTSPSPRD